MHSPQMRERLLTTLMSSVVTATREAPVRRMRAHMPLRTAFRKWVMAADLLARVARTTQNFHVAGHRLAALRDGHDMMPGQIARSVARHHVPGAPPAMTTDMPPDAPPAQPLPFGVVTALGGCRPIAPIDGFVSGQVHAHDVTLLL